MLGNKVKLLLGNKGDVNASERVPGSTSLHAAGVSQHTKVVKQLPHKKANVNAKEHIPCSTPLHVVDVSKRRKKVKRLSPSKAGVKARTRAAVSEGPLGPWTQQQK